MNDKEEIYPGPVEQKIKSWIENTKSATIQALGKKTEWIAIELIQQIFIENLNNCMLYLAKEIDELAKPTE